MPIAEAIDGVLGRDLQIDSQSQGLARHFKLQNRTVCGFAEINMAWRGFWFRANSPFDKASSGHFEGYLERLPRSASRSPKAKTRTSTHRRKSIASPRTTGADRDLGSMRNKAFRIVKLRLAPKVLATRSSGFRPREGAAAGRAWILWTQHVCRWAKPLAWRGMQDGLGRGRNRAMCLRSTPIPACPLRRLHAAQTRQARASVWRMSGLVPLPGGRSNASLPPH